MPSKRGRGKGKGKRPPIESSSYRSESDQQRGNRGRGRGARYVSSFESDESQSHKHHSEKLGDYDTSSQPSTSGYKESHREHKETSYHPEPGQKTGYRGQRRGGGYVSSFESDQSQSSTHQSEKSCDYESSSLPSTSGYKDSRRENKGAPEDTGFEFTQSFSDKSSRGTTHKIEKARDRDESHRDCAYKVEIPHDYEESPKGSNHPTKKPYDYDTSTPSTSKHKDPKGHKVSAEDIGFKFDGRFSQNSFPVRSGFGKLGRQIKVVSNCYPIEFHGGYVYHYDIEIIDNNPRKTPASEHKKYRCLNTKRNREVIAFMLGHNPHFKGFYGAFDGQKNLLTRKELKVNLPFTCVVTLPDENTQDDSQSPKYDNFRVEILSLVSKINLDSIQAFYKRKCNDMPQEAIMALETIIRHNPCLKFTPIGRSFFCPPNRENLTPFGGGLEIWFGYHQGIRLCQWAPTVNLDVSATTFWDAGPVINFIADQMNMSVRDLQKLQFLNRNVIRRLNKKLSQRQVKVTHLNYGRKYRIIELRNSSANEEYIENRDNSSERPKSVAQYFKETYGKELEFGNLPCLQVQPKKKNIFMPIEVCKFIEGQHYKGELTSQQKAKMIEFTSNPPHERFRKIQEIVHEADFNRDKVVQEFGIKISDKPIVTDARVLASPNLVYKDRYDAEKRVLPHDGTWDVRNIKFYRGAVISRWVLISFYPDRNLEIFADLLAKIGRNLGLELGALTDIKVFRGINFDKKQLFEDLKRKKNELAVIVIPRIEEKEEKRLYAEIKKVTETEVGLPTQCIKAENLRDMGGKRGPQIASNLCLKINPKLGGENHSLYERDLPTIFFKPVIIIGADVNHPAPTQPNQPSIAACVASLDCLGKRFGVSVRAQVHSKEQKKKVEEILALEDMVYDLLFAFYKHTRAKKPEKIIFYRDGVSEGELGTVKRNEVVRIRKACLKLDKDYKPGITVIIVQKRHHVRFRPLDRKDGVGRKGNIPPGTVVDTNVTHPINFDFFLCSQYGLQGTSRPSHYLVLEDDSKLSADELQKLTFYMCHMSVRCTKSISIPAPVAYADLVAYRARKHLDFKKGGDSSSSRDCSTSYRLTQEDINAIEVVQEMKGSMYFV